MAGWAIVLVVILSLPLAVALAGVGARLLGVGRSWVKLAVAGTIGWLSGLLLTAALNDFEKGGWAVIRDLVLFPLVVTMVVAVVFDLLAKPGTLAKGEEAGLIEIGNPLAQVRASRERSRRVREIISIARANGIDIIPRRGGSKEEYADPMPVRVRRTLEQCGGMFVKLGQVASTRPDLVPESLAVELGHLQSNAEPAPIDEVRALLQQEFGRSPDEVFERFDWEPLASASIAQVHRARLRTGEEVVLKVQRPGVQDIIRRDLDVLNHLARTAAARTTVGRDYNVVELASEFGSSLTAELDFTVEARNTAEAAANLAGEANVVVPAVYPEYCTTKVLVMDFLPGVSVARTDLFEEMGVDRRVLAEQVLRVALRQMLVDGFFHSDLHPGNIFVLPGDKVGMLDFGAVGRIDPITKEGLVYLLGGFAVKNPGLVVRGTRKVASFGAEVDDADLEKEVARFLVVGLAQGLTPAALQDMLAMYRRLRITLPADLLTLMRALVVVQGTVAEIDGSYSVIQAAKELAPELTGPMGQTTDDGTPATPQDLMQAELIEVLPVLRELPSQIGRSLGQLQRGELRTRVSLFGSETDRASMLTLANRLGLSLLSGLLVLSGAIMVGNEGGPTVTPGFGLVSLIGYLVLFLGLIVALRVVTAAVRDGA